MIRIKRGLDLPIQGEPVQVIADSPKLRSVAVLGRDFVGLKPGMKVQVGERVRIGDTLFVDKQNPDVNITAPASGTVAAIHRVERRRLLSVLIDVDPGDQQFRSFDSFTGKPEAELSPEEIQALLLESGQWCALRTRPFSKVPDPGQKPSALFINAMDSNPLALKPGVVLADARDDFVAGIRLLARLCDGPVFVCIGRDDRKLMEGLALPANVRVEVFHGPHPAGLTGTHIHYLHPAGLQRRVWSCHYQDAIATARLFQTGKLSTRRVVSFGGPQVLEPRLIELNLGANLDEVCAAELVSGESRIVSGSALAGHAASGAEAFLGRYHLQVSVFREGRERPLFGYLSPGRNRHSVMGIYVSGLFPDRRFPMSTSAQGSDRAMVPIGAYEKVMPLDILPTQLLRSLVVGDIESAINLGALELEEEDLALCSYVCPGKYEFGPILRDNLTRIEQEA